MNKRLLVFFVSFFLAAASVLGQEARPLRVDDIFELKTVRDPRISPEGDWVAFTVSTLDAETDTTRTGIHMVPFAGGEAVRLTAGDKGDTHPRWSPDGRYLAFLSARDDTGAQVWLLDRRGGEAVRLTEYKGGVSAFEWSPESRRLALIVTDPDPEAEADPGEKRDRAKDPPPKPIVIDRLQFKRDGVGYLTERRRHIHVFDLETKTSIQVTRGPYDHSQPVWSPDGSRLAFTSNRTEEPDSNFNEDAFIVAPAENQEPRRLTTSEGSDTSPAFSPDGRWIAYIEGGDPREIWYATNNVAVVAADPEPGDPPRPRVLTEGLDRNLAAPRFSPDGTEVLFLLEDRNNEHLAAVSVEGGAVRRVVSGERAVLDFDLGARGEIVVLETEPLRPPEVSAMREGALDRITHINDAFLAGIALGPVELIHAPGTDGTVIDAFLTRPPGHREGQRVPTLLRIHGGPVAQFSNSFNLEWQLLAAQGYAVIGANPRGSSGRGRDFSQAIWADWGNKDFRDVMEAVDRAIEMGVADPERLGVGGWSYGGILTNYVIVQTDRFKAAISGSSEVNYTANYGHDHYQRHWEAELGLPWENTELWIRLSPFFRVAAVTTPTLVMCGQQDWNVPLQNSEQLYQALRRLGVETQLVVYPGESHGIRRPSFQRDLYQRYIDWYDRYLKAE
jgi:dipeptidyl aminopeptidase/acylaminoacyl peptidase